MNNQFQQLVFFNDNISQKVAIKPILFQKNIAIVVHVFYIDIWQELKNYLNQLQIEFDLYITVTDEMKDENILQIFEDRPDALVYTVENKGRDVLPFLQIMNLIGTDSYKYICKMHTKKSVSNDNGDIWRKLLYYDLIGSNKIVKNIIKEFDEDKELGVITGKNVILDAVKYDFGNMSQVKSLASIANLDFLKDYTFAAGTMFWTRSELLDPIVRLLKDDKFVFEKEGGQTDNTLAHAVERFFGFICKSKGFILLESKANYKKLDRDILEELASLAFFQRFEYGGLYTEVQEKEQEIALKNQKIQKRDKQIHEGNAEIAKMIEENNQRDMITKEKDQLINELLNSRSMKITRPMRQFIFVSKTLLNFKKDKLYIPGTDEHRFAQAIKRRIPEKLFLKLKSFVTKEISQNLQDMPWSKPLTATSKNLGQRVLIIAELSLPQCKKYRVDQKVEMLKHLGYNVSVVSWNDSTLCRQFLQLHALVIFYRVPGFDSVIELLEETKRLKIVTFFDVDDLIFDRELMTQNENINKLQSQELEEILNGADLYQSVLSSVDHIISSTHTLGDQMKRYNDGELYIIKNCLDDQLYDFATTHSIVKSQGDEVKIVYGSGTSTHDEDFLEVADALVQILQKYSHVKLYIHGILNLPPEFENFAEQVIKVPFSNADKYYRSLSSYDINIAPLETSIFNDAKSNIKFLEAAIFKTPTVASKAAEFIDVINHAENGFLADNTQEWLNALELLVLDANLRANIGKKAYEVALDQYSLKNVAMNSFKPLLDKYLPQKKKRRKKILMVNILFQPISFGGATIVVEELAKLVNNKEEFEVTVFTGFWDAGGHQIYEYGLVRYEANDLPIMAVRFPPMTPELEYKNDHMENIFEDVLKTVQPDLVHFHSIQQLSASLVTSCQRHNTPYSITLHDMWWLCEKQFMVMPNNKYCHQLKIDTDFCINNCTKNITFTEERTKFLKPILENADLLLTPSAFQAEMYLHNELAPDKIKVNKNGIQFPLDGFKKTKSDKVRFAYLGGNAVHKGYDHIKEIFESITASNYELVLVDLHRKLGHNSIFESDWDIKGQLTISDGYEYGQKGLDDFFSSIDVLLFPSQWKESFGLTIREALVRDVWVISTDAGGVVEDIVEGENGNVIALTDANAYKEKIETCLNNLDFFHDYTNPHKDQIRSYDEQTYELVKYYNTILG